MEELIKLKQVFVSSTILVPIQFDHSVFCEPLLDDLV